jgi:hypothetical protein
MLETEVSGKLILHCTTSEQVETSSKGRATMWRQGTDAGFQDVEAGSHGPEIAAKPYTGYTVIRAGLIACITTTILSFSVLQLKKV